MCPCALLICEFIYSSSELQKESERRGLSREGVHYSCIHSGILYLHTAIQDGPQHMHITFAHISPSINLYNTRLSGF